MSKKVVSILAVLAAVSCGDDPAPTAPSLVPAAGAPPAAAAGGGSSAVPPARQADLQPAAPADVRRLEPGAGGHGEFNAYDFEASWDGSMLQLALIEDEMRSMRGASKPHRNRRITVGTCPSEPHHALQSCGDPIWSGSRMLANRLELPPIPLAECGGWIVVSAAELSDDLYDGWRNAPCPNPDGGTVGSDGSGETWPEYPEPPAAPRPPETVQSNVDTEIAAAGGLTAGGAPRSVGVSDLFDNAGGTTGDQYSATSSDETVATVAITDNPRVVVTPVGPGKATIRVTALETGDTVEFDVTVGEPGNDAPAITNPGNKQYVPGQTIEAFSIAVSDADGDGVTVGVSGLPSGLSWSAETNMVSGTVAADAALQPYTVTVTANDGVNEAVTLDFTITVTANMPPTITNPGDKEYVQGTTIEAFSIDVTDANGDDVTVGVSGLPSGLSWSAETNMVSGTVAAAAQTGGYTVTVTADDGVNEAVTATFTITVERNLWPVDLAIPHAGGSSRMVIQRPGTDGWSSGSCTFGGSTFAYRVNGGDFRGLRCDVRIDELAGPDLSREFRFGYYRYGVNNDGDANAPICHGLSSLNFDGTGRVDFGGSYNVGDPYDADRWFCQMRDYNPATSTYPANKIRNVRFDTNSRQLTFEINLGGELLGRRLRIGFQLWNHPAPGGLTAEPPAAGTFDYQSFPD